MTEFAINLMRQERAKRARFGITPAINRLQGFNHLNVKTRQKIEKVIRLLEQNPQGMTSAEIIESLKVSQREKPAYWQMISRASKKGILGAIKHKTKTHINGTRVNVYTLPDVNSTNDFGGRK